MATAKSKIIVCVLGAHRSGTSMLAHLLHRCGVDLGRSSDMMPPKPDNVDGFWENLRFVSINDDLLATFGGSWDWPPQQPLNRWHCQNQLQDLQIRAQALIAEFKNVPVWGWKDPRNCLTLPFWQNLIPDLKIVLIVRDPCEVALSLTARNGVSHIFGFNLWRTYYERVLSSIEGYTPIITHYSSYFEDTATELARILNLLGLPSDGAGMASQSVSPQARHHYHSPENMQGLVVPARVADLYRILTTEEG